MKLKLVGSPDGDPQKFEVRTADGELVENVCGITASRSADDPYRLDVTVEFFVFPTAPRTGIEDINRTRLDLNLPILPHE